MLKKRIYLVVINFNCQQKEMYETGDKYKWQNKKWN